MARLRTSRRCVEPAFAVGESGVNKLPLWPVRGEEIAFRTSAGGGHGIGVWIYEGVFHGLSIDSSFARRHAGILLERLDIQDRIEKSQS